MTGTPFLTTKWSKFGHVLYSRGHSICNCRGALQYIRNMATICQINNNTHHITVHANSLADENDFDAIVQLHTLTGGKPNAIF